MTGTTLPSGASRIVFILAHPAAHVRAPSFYTPYFREAGLDWHMVPLDVAPDDLEPTIRALARAKNVVGFNLTMPHKPAAFRLCDAVEPAARFEEVVNTIRIADDGRLIGGSFDGTGFLDAARAAGVFDPARRCVVIGAGGAGCAICHALAVAGVTRLGIVDSAPLRARSLATRLREKFPDLDFTLDADFADAGLIVNATPLGLDASDPMPAEPDAFPPDCGVFDIIAARRTEFMDACEARGLTVVGGVAMIRHQLPPQTAFWLGRDGSASPR